MKILTSVRVSQKQKKIDLDIPKLSVFIHQVYSTFARKLYKNVYLFEKFITPLQYQKNMRECEILCKESILEVIRNSIPVEKILRSYIDETVDEEVVQEIVEKEIEKEVEPETKVQEPTTNDESNEEFSKTPILKLEKNNQQEELSLNYEKNEETGLSNDIDSSSLEDTNEDTKKVGISFNDVDSVLDMGTNKEEDVEAPKTIERLEQISEINQQRRKEEEEDDDEDNLEIFSDNNINLDISDIHDLSKELKIDTPPLLDDIELLE